MLLNFSPSAEAMVCSCNSTDGESNACDRSSTYIHLLTLRLVAVLLRSAVQIAQIQTRIYRDEENDEENVDAYGQLRCEMQVRDAEFHSIDQATVAGDRCHRFDGLHLRTHGIAVHAGTLLPGHVRKNDGLIAREEFRFRRVECSTEFGIVVGAVDEDEIDLDRRLSILHADVLK